MLDASEMADAVFLAVEGYIERRLEPVLARLTELEARGPVNGKDGEPGSPGKDADPAVIERMVADAVARIPAPINGKDGAPGSPGRDADMGEIRRLIEIAAEKALAKLPVPGDGVGVAGAVIDRSGNLVLTLSNGQMVDLGRVVGRDADPALVERLVADSVAQIPIPRDGKDGKDGRNGFSLDDFDTELQEDGRTLHFKFEAGDTLEIHEIEFPFVIYRGVFVDGTTYAKGDLVTWAGSLWHCNAETSEKPGEGSKAWTLAAKKGRDGKDGQAGPPGERGLEGRPGRDLTQLGPGGEKW